MWEIHGIGIGYVSDGPDKSLKTPHELKVANIECPLWRYCLHELDGHTRVICLTLNLGGNKQGCSDIGKHISDTALLYIYDQLTSSMSSELEPSPPSPPWIVNNSTWISFLQDMPWSKGSHTHSELWNQLRRSHAEDNKGSFHHSPSPFIYSFLENFDIWTSNMRRALFQGCSALSFYHDNYSGLHILQVPCQCLTWKHWMVTVFQNISGNPQ